VKKATFLFDLLTLYPFCVWFAAYALDALSGVPFTFEGTVIGFAQDGSLTLATTTDGNVQLYGIGPVYFWESQNV